MHSDTPNVVAGLNDLRLGFVIQAVQTVRISLHSIEGEIGSLLCCVVPGQFMLNSNRSVLTIRRDSNSQFKSR